MYTHWLKRKRITRQQSTRPGHQRIRNVRNAFALTDAADVTGKRILVVDDVYTSGATVNECARTLCGAGAREVVALTLARALEPSGPVVSKGPAG